MYVETLSASLDLWNNRYGRNLINAFRELQEEGVLEIIGTPQGERMRFTSSRPAPDLRVVVTIVRAPSPDEVLDLAALQSGTQFLSSSAPDEPHEFDAILQLRLGVRSEALPFHMSEPEDHHGH